MKVELLYSATKPSAVSAMTKIGYSSTTGSAYDGVCIKSLPDLPLVEEKEQLETTTLCDDAHEYMDGIGVDRDDMEFTFNADKSEIDALKAVVAEETQADGKGGYYAIHFSKMGTSGTHFFFRAKMNFRINGAGVNEVVEGTIVLKRKSAISDTIWSSGD